MEEDYTPLPTVLAEEGGRMAVEEERIYQGTATELSRHRRAAGVLGRGQGWSRYLRHVRI